MAERKQGRPVIPCSWADPEDAVVVGLTPAQAREMASALIVYAFFVDRANAALGEGEDG